MTSTWPITWLLSTALAPILGHQFLLNYIKDKHQPSGRDLLLTISTSIGKYLYESQLREKTHNQEQGNTPLNPRQKVSTNQSVPSFSLTWIKGPTNTSNRLRTVFDSGKTDLRAYIAVTQLKMSQVGAKTKSADHPGRSTKHWRHSWQSLA